jgi:hypothetical protein
MRKVLHKIFIIKFTLILFTFNWVKWDLNAQVNKEITFQNESNLEFLEEYLSSGDGSLKLDDIPDSDPGFNEYGEIFSHFSGVIIGPLGNIYNVNKHIMSFLDIKDHLKIIRSFQNNLDSFRKKSHSKNSSCIKEKDEFSSLKSWFLFLAQQIFEQDKNKSPKGILIAKIPSVKDNNKKHFYTDLKLDHSGNFILNLNQGILRIYQRKNLKKFFEINASPNYVDLCEFDEKSNTLIYREREVIEYCRVGPSETFNFKIKTMKLSDKGPKVISHGLNHKINCIKLDDSPSIFQIIPERQMYLLPGKDEVRFIDLETHNQLMNPVKILGKFVCYMESSQLVVSINKFPKREDGININADEREILIWDFKTQELVKKIYPTITKTNNYIFTPFDIVPSKKINGFIEVNKSTYSFWNLDLEGEIDSNSSSKYRILSEPVWTREINYGYEHIQVAKDRFFIKSGGLLGPQFIKIGDLKTGTILNSISLKQPDICTYLYNLSPNLDMIFIQGENGEVLVYKFRL